MAKTALVLRALPVYVYPVTPQTGQSLECQWVDGSSSYFECFFTNLYEVLRRKFALRSASPSR